MSVLPVSNMLAFPLPILFLGTVYHYHRLCHQHRHCWPCSTSASSHLAMQVKLVMSSGCWGTKEIECRNAPIIVSAWVIGTYIWAKISKSGKKGENWFFVITSSKLVKNWFCKKHFIRNNIFYNYCFIYVL